MSYAEKRNSNGFRPIIFANEYGSFKELTSEFNEPELEFSEFKIEENVKKYTASEHYPRSLKSNREKWLEKYGKHLHPQSNKNITYK